MLLISVPSAPEPLPGSVQEDAAGSPCQGSHGYTQGLLRGATSVLFRTICVRVRVALVHGAGVVLRGSSGVRSVLQGELSKGWILFAGLTQ